MRFRGLFLPFGLVWQSGTQSVIVFAAYRWLAVGGYTEIAGNGLAKRYKETRGFMNVPQSQIILSEGILTQTPGFDSEDTKSWMFSNGNLPYKETVAY